MLGQGAGRRYEQQAMDARESQSLRRASLMNQAAFNLMNVCKPHCKMH